MKAGNFNGHNGDNERLVLTLLISLLLHLLLFFSADGSKNNEIQGLPPAHKYRVNVVKLPDNKYNALPPITLADKNIDYKPKTKTEEEKKKEEKKEEEKKKDEIKPDGQIVELAAPEKEEKPSKSDYLSQFDIKVKDESKSKYQDIYENAAPRPSLMGMKKETLHNDAIKDSKNPLEQKIVLKSETPEEKAKQAEKKSKFENKEEGAEKLKFEIPKSGMEKALAEKDPQAEIKLPEESKNFINSPSTNNPSDKLDVNLQLGALNSKSEKYDFKKGEESDKNDAKQSSGSEIVIDKNSIISIAGGPMADYLDNVKEGEETSLNSKSFKYATFFNRVKKEIARNWHPATIHRRNDPTFNVYGYQDRRTLVYITLSKDGAVEKVEILEGCGVSYLDEEAVNSIYRASPFPNPPAGLIKDGKANFPFGFYFQISSVKFKSLD